MKTSELMSVREYLTTSFRPDREYVEGEILERNVGEYDRAKLQRSILLYFHARRKQWGTHVIPGQRVQVSPARFRVPDVCVTLGAEPEEQVFTRPPFICIEILSPEDRLAAMEERVADFLKMGVPYVWIVNPRTRKAWRCTAQGMLEERELRTEDPAIVVPVDALFED